MAFLKSVCYDFAMMLYRGAFAVVDLTSIESNIRSIKSLLEPSTKLLVSVKANGYGHGAAQVAQSAVAAGADYLGVASLEEGLALRDAGLDARILVFGVVPPEGAAMAARQGIDLALSTSWDSVLDRIGDDPSPDALARVLGLERANPPLRLHLKLDTGMARIGFRDEDQLMRWARRLAISRGVEAAGLFTHLARADEPGAGSTEVQLARLRRVEQQLAAESIRPTTVHAANSAGTLLGTDYHFDMVRIGISTYGYRPSVSFASPIALRPALNLYAFLTRIVELDPGEAVGYGGTFVTRRKTKVATIPVGYGDGYPRWLSNRGHVVIHGQEAPVLGRVCMDQLMVDVTEIDGAQVGDCACLYGRHAPTQWTSGALWGGERAGSSEAQAAWIRETFADETCDSDLLSLDTLAEIGQTISYEMMCALSTRIPRIYVSR